MQLNFNEMSIAQEIEKRRTFGIISHPDAGKTTLTEKLLLFGGAIQKAGAVLQTRMLAPLLDVQKLMLSTSPFL